MRAIRYVSALLFILIVSCKQEENTAEKTLFRLLPAGYTGIDFNNQLNYTEELNTYTFKNFYNGGGVGLGDFNNDGLVDVFFSGNLVESRLYLNKGNLKFEDITERSNINTKGVWATGVSVADVNGDGWLDMYICKSGPPGGARRHNELFINNGDLTFTDRSKEYGLDFEGLSTHAAFFDYDKDGDLDCYLLNNSIRSVGVYDLRKNQRDIPDTLGGNKLLRNDNGFFKDVTVSAGIYCSAIGFGLGVTIGDINLDGWPDMYISNDFFEKDYLYINNRDGSFSELLEKHITEISLGSMGADMADINNDGLPEIFVTEMLPETDERLKTTTQFESWDRYKAAVDNGYYHQFSRNVLQLNNGDGTFSEISRLAGVHATDWSWGSLIFDMDNDGNKDIFVANGIYKDLLDQDYVNFIAQPKFISRILRSDDNVIKTLIDSIPSNKISNYAFANDGTLIFTNQSVNWGLSTPSHSNGSAYGDLDNDGDLDLVVSNVNMPAFIYENRAREIIPQYSSVSFSLVGLQRNSKAIGTKVTVWSNGQRFYQEVFPMRGFMSSVNNNVLVGLGKTLKIDSVIVNWPDDNVTILKNLLPNQQYVLNQSQADRSHRPHSKRTVDPVLIRDSLPGVNFLHRENDYVDFNRDRLLFNMISNEGPCLCVGDINNDGRDDFYIGGAKNQPGSLFVQNKSGAFSESNKQVFELDKVSEDTDCAFFDANGDGFQDLYVTSGSNEFSSNSVALIDRLYINQAGRTFKKSNQILPVQTRFENTATVSPYDYDQDGDVDLFVGVRSIPLYYGVPANGYLLRNDGSGTFADVTREVASGLLNLGMITDAKWCDVNNDNLIDLVVAGEWMPINIFINENGRLINRTKEYGLSSSNGWYNVLATADLNNDGYIDLVAGNHGLNSRFKGNLKEPVVLHVNDFDKNGTVDHVITTYNAGVSYPLVLRQDLVSQIPSLKKKFLHFSSYKSKKIEDIFSAEQMQNTVTAHAYTFETAVWLNTGGESFRKKVLPIQSQFSPVYSMLIDDFDSDGKNDILLGGNQHRAKPETGIYSATYGLLLRGKGDGSFVALSSLDSGVLVKGEIRAMKNINVDHQPYVLIARNNNSIKVLKYNRKKSNEK